MTLFRQRVSSLQVEGLQADIPIFNKDGDRCPLPPVEGQEITVKAGEVVLVISLSKDKKSVEVTYAPRKGKAHSHQTRSGHDGAVLQVTL